MPALTGYGPPDKSAQTAGDYLSSSKPSYGIGSSSTNYPTQTPSGSITPATSATADKSANSYASNNQSPTGNKNNLWNLVTQSLTPAQQAQWTAIGKGYQSQSKSRQQNLMDNDKAISGTAYNNSLNKSAPTDVAGKGIELYSILTPEQQQLWKNAEKAEEGGSFLQGIMPLLALGLAFVGGEALMGVGGAGAGAGASTVAAAGDAAAATGAAAETVLGTGTLAAETGAGLVAEGTLGAGTLADISVTASSLGGIDAGLTAGEIGAGLGAGIGGAIDLTGASGSAMPTVNYPQGLSQYTPKNLISNKLQDLGMPKLPANMIGGAGQGSLMSAAQGGDPLKGALGGSLGVGVGAGIAETGLGNAVSSAVGGGVPGDMLSGAATSALGGGITAGVMGGNSLLAAESGAIGGAVGAGLKDAGLSSGFASTIGSQLGKAATMPSSPTGTSNISSGLDGLGSSMMNGLSNLPVADLAGLYAGGKANKQNQGLIDQLSNVANPFISAGQTALKDYQNLAPLEQQQLNASVTGGTTQVQGAQPLIGLGEQQLNIAGSGNLPPAQEAQLQQQIQAAKAQLAQQYSPDSTTYQELSAKIDQNAMLTRQQMLAGYQTSGQTTYGLGEAQQTAGQTEIAKAYSDAQTEIDQNLKNALAMATTGLGPLTDAVMLGLQNNKQMQSTMSDLFKSIAGASAGSSGASSTVGGMLKNVFSGGSNTASDTNLNNLLGQYGAPQGSFVDPSTFMSGYQDNTPTYAGNTTSDTNFDNLMSDYTASSDTGS